MTTNFVSRPSGKTQTLPSNASLASPPDSTARVESAMDKAPPSSKLHPARARVLVADDEASAAAASALLREEGFEVVLAEDGARRSRKRRRPRPTSS